MPVVEVRMEDAVRQRWKLAGAIALWAVQFAYVVFPFDLIPDFIPVIGWIDDLVGLGGLGATSLFLARTVHDVGFSKLLGLDAPSSSIETSVDYDPIPLDVLRSM